MTTFDQQEHQVQTRAEGLAAIDGRDWYRDLTPAERRRYRTSALAEIGWHQLTIELDTQTIQHQFETFHRENPHVYAELVKLARRARARGGDRIGIGMLFEIVRWRRAMATTDWSGFKLNNNYRSRYARLIEAQEPDLAGVFEKRELRAA